MQVTVNGAPREIPEGLSVKGLIAHLALAAGPVAVEVNRAIVPRAKHAEHVVHAGDAVEIVQFVGGG